MTRCHPGGTCSDRIFGAHHIRRRRAEGVLICLSVVLAFAVWRLELREPRYNGRTLSAWLSDLDLESARPQPPAVAAIQTMGTNAFPQLDRMLCSTDPGWKQALLVVNRRQSFFQLPITPARVLRNRAIQAYTAMGARAKSNVPSLIRLLDSKRAEVRASVAAALGGIGPEAKEAIPVLVRATQDMNPQVQKESVLALANIQRWDGGRLH